MDCHHHRCHNCHPKIQSPIDQCPVRQRLQLELVAGCYLHPYLRDHLSNSMIWLARPICGWAVPLCLCLVRWQKVVLMVDQSSCAQAFSCTFEAFCLSHSHPLASFLAKVHDLFPRSPSFGGGASSWYAACLRHPAPFFGLRIVSCPDIVEHNLKKDFWHKLVRNFGPQGEGVK